MVRQQRIDYGLLCAGNGIGADSAGIVASKLDAVPHLILHSLILAVCAACWILVHRGEGGGDVRAAAHRLWLAVCRQSGRRRCCWHFETQGVGLRKIRKSNPSHLNGGMCPEIDTVEEGLPKDLAQ